MYPFIIWLTVHHYLYTTTQTKTSCYKCSQVTMNTLITMGDCLVIQNMRLHRKTNVNMLRWQLIQGSVIWCHYLKWPGSPVTSHWVPYVIHSVYWLANFHTVHLRGPWNTYAPTCGFLYGAYAENNYLKWPGSPVTSHWVPYVIHSVYWLANFHTVHLRGP
jgi:hypothetical protein